VREAPRNDRYNQELKRLEEQMKLYVPESDPEAKELNDIFQLNRNFENNMFELGFGTNRED
jgi:hypothetical protein